MTRHSKGRAHLPDAEAEAEAAELLRERRRDNLPQPVTAGNPYVPINPPAIGNLMDLFRFP